MKVLLKKDVQGTGRKGEIKEVAEGFYRNFLMPRGLAIVAAEKTFEELERQKAKIVEDEEKRKKAIIDFIRAMKEKPLSIKAKLDEGGRLFGSVNAATLETELKKRSINVEKLQGKIILPEPIKTSGSHQVAVQFPHNVRGLLSVVIEKE